MANPSRRRDPASPDCTDSRVHALINDPTTEGIDEG